LQHIETMLPRKISVIRHSEFTSSATSIANHRIPFFFPTGSGLTSRLCGHASALSGRTKRKLPPSFYGGHVC
jgi:hypothetical protein